MTDQNGSKPLNWIQILATLCFAIALLCLLIWGVGRGNGTGEIAFILIGAILFGAIGGALWLLGAFVAGLRGK